MLCEQYEKICVSADSCMEFIELPIIASITEEVLMTWEFNGRKYQSIVSVEAGEKIRIPNHFNENYLHKVILNLSGGYSKSNAFSNGFNSGFIQTTSEVVNKLFLIDVKICVNYG